MALVYSLTYRLRHTPTGLAGVLQPGVTLAIDLCGLKLLHLSCEVLVLLRELHHEFGLGLEPGALSQRSIRPQRAKFKQAPVQLRDNKRRSR